ncbi:MAG: substrate-binding domain-containing protein [Rhodospirillales bacterium]|nr:substrate-binding domain-containing protein [Rhodospirillales bacterium]
MTIRLFSTLAVQGAIAPLLPGWEGALGQPIAARFGPTQVLRAALDGGEAADVVILTAEGIADLAASGRVEAASAVDLAWSFVGIAQAPGAPHPDIATEAAFVATLRAAASIAYSRAGASGIFFAGLIARLGIAEEIAAKATVVPAGLTGALVMDGRCQYAIQQVSELRMVPGIDVIGRLPATLQVPGMFSAAARSADPATAALLARLADPALAAAYREAGLEPVHGG